MRATTRRGTVAAALVAVLLSAGCTVSDRAEDPDGSTEAAPATTTPDDPAPSPEAPQGPSPEELSAQVLRAASAGRPAPVASQTVTVAEAPDPGTSAEVTFDVLSLERTRDATLLTVQMSSSEPEVRLGRQALDDSGSANLEFFDRFALEDAGNGVRHLPLSWLRAGTNNLQPPDGPPNSCICPYRGNDLVLSPEPLVFEALYGPLPEDVTTVTFTAPGGVSIPDLPVEPADG